MVSWMVVQRVVSKSHCQAKGVRIEKKEMTLFRLEMTLARLWAFSNHLV